MPKINYETKGSEVLTVANLPGRTTADLIVNEDYQIVVKVTSASDGIIRGHKVWDSSSTEEKKIFTAMLKYHGRDGIPPNGIFENGEYVLFDRVGWFEGTGKEGFELKIQNHERTSWICLIWENPIIFVKSFSGCEGQEVRYDGATNTWVIVDTSPVLNLIAPDPFTQFYDGLPPYEIDRIYPAQRFNNLYVTYLPGYGPVSKTFALHTGGCSFFIDTDSSGNVRAFRDE